MDRPTHGGALPPDWNETKQPLLYAICGLFIGLTTISVVIRIILQMKVHRRLFWDDIWIILSMVTYFTTTRSNLATAEFYDPGNSKRTFGDKHIRYVRTKLIDTVSRTLTNPGIKIGLGFHAPHVMMTDPKPPTAFTKLWQVSSKCKAMPRVPF